MRRNSNFCLQQNNKLENNSTALLTPKPPLLLSWTAVRLCLGLWETVIFVYRLTPSWRTILLLTPKPPLLSWTAVRLSCLGLWETVIFVYRRSPSWRTILLLTPKPLLLSWMAVRLCLGLWETVIFVYRTPRWWRTILLLTTHHQNHPCYYLEWLLLDFVSAYEKQ